MQRNATLYLVRPAFRSSSVPTKISTSGQHVLAYPGSGERATGPETAKISVASPSTSVVDRIR
jgi:hypothetical protein